VTLHAPTASDPIDNLADWLEIQALTCNDGIASLESLVSIIRQGGSTDAVEDEDDPSRDQGSEISQQIASDALSAAETRVKACGGRYPFEVSQGHLRLRAEAANSPYLFLLLLSLSEPTSGYKGTAVLFENLCTHVAQQYLGGAAIGADAWRFGSPRKAPVSVFSAAIDHLCTRIAEGGGCIVDKVTKHKGDNGLDIVAWKHFPDKRAGKLIAFGQCAAGSVNWGNKLNELDGRNFARKWFRETLLVEPLRFFFVPRCIPSNIWRTTSIDAGVVFDRCRIAALLDGLDSGIGTQCQAAVASLVAKL
jgi:hypothetical protein